MQTTIFVIVVVVYHDTIIGNRHWESNYILAYTEWNRSVYLIMAFAQIDDSPWILVVFFYIPWGANNVLRATCSDISNLLVREKGLQYIIVQNI